MKRHRGQVYLDMLSLQWAQSVGVAVDGRGVEGPASNSISGSAETVEEVVMLGSTACPAVSESDAVDMVVVKKFQQGRPSWSVMKFLAASLVAPERAK